MTKNNVDSLVENYQILKKSFKLRKSANYIEIITSSGQKLYHNKTDKFRGGLYLFQMVKKDIEKFIQDNGAVEPYQELPVNYSNKDFDYSKKIIGLDINNAYWSVAYLKGYLSKKTYLKGIEKDNLKSIRLSCLSSLGKKRIYQCYEKGEYVYDEEIKGDELLENIYKDIRFSTYGVMLEIAQELGNDFCCWKTDCIFFADNEINNNIAKEIIESYGLECKVELKKIKL